MKNTLLFLLSFASLSILAQIPSNYYDSANGLSGYALKSQLHTIISNGHNDQGYGALYTGYQTTDSDNYYENDGSVLDMYSENPSGTDPYNYTHGNNTCGTYSHENDCYNREHIIPQSVFGQQYPMRSDIHFVVPSDGYVNGRRSNYPFGEVSNPSWTSMNGSKVGSNTFGGYSGTVFEPIDEFKGDIARMLFYFATRYETQVDSWSHDMFDGTEDHVFSDWFLDLILLWHTNDPVSQRELDRNNAAYNFQGNANPFISNPAWVYTIWNPNPDTENPTAPTNLTADNLTHNSVHLNWNAATDNVGVVAYEIYKNGSLLDTSPLSNYTVSSLSNNTSYTFYVVALDAAGNSSTNSNSISITTLNPPTYIINEDFNDCAIVGNSFTAYSEASDKDWTCQTQHGHNNTGCYSVNGYQENVASKDWLITSNPIDFTQYTNESLSVYLIYAYGTTPLELVYSTNYPGSGNPSSYTWNAVPNVSINTPTGSSSPSVQEITNVDISAISQSAYLAFKYYSNGSPTRWNVDDFSIISSNGTSVDSFEKENIISIYPNPTTNIFTVKSKTSIDHIYLYNLLGQEIFTSTPNTEKTTINLSNFDFGSYIIKISTETKTKVFKVIKRQ